MRTFLLLATTSTITASFSYVSRWDEFNKFVKQYNKSYETIIQRYNAYFTFQTNYNFIENHEFSFD